ncbi:MATE family efflux transporter [Treponema vincentii]|uniref:MATE family efflux transporter n=1 Tax=Treponema vincentii TaxID=69710 RepID=UPI0020A4AF3E|nr:MATE family efflux transporter [Treponema vincentii]UTC46221.1 MATE family efflux transporter [Treponema vincentii]
MEEVKARPIGPAENKMGVMPIMKLILNMSLPMMFSMLIMALYNIVDSIFVAKISEDALTAVSLAFPIQNLMISFAVGTGIGVNALLSKRLGQHNQEDVNKTAMNAVFLAACNFIVFFIAGLILVRPYLASQGVEANIIAYGEEYLNIVLSMSFVLFFGITFDRLLQSTGLTLYTMYSQLSGAVFNVIFDPLLIFGIGPFPKMGIRGAALATVLGQILGLCVSVFCNLTKNREIQFKLKNIVPEPRIIAEIYKVGVPSILLSSITSVTTYFLNIILSAFSSTAIAVYGVYFKLNSFIFMPVFGLNNGMVPIIAYNYGAQNRKRITATIRNGLLLAIGIMLFGMALFELFPAQLLGLFDASPAMLAIGVPAIRIIACSFIGAALGITFSSVFQAFGSAVYSMIATFVRQIVALLPAAYLLSLTGDVNAIWWSYLIAEVVSIIACLFFMHRIYKKKIAPMPVN